MKQHLLKWGGIGAAVLVAVSLLFNVDPEGGFSLGCLVSLIVPLVVGYLASREGVANGTVASMGHGAVEGGIAAGLAALIGGTLNVLIGYFRAQSELSAAGLSGFESTLGSSVISLLLSGVIVLAIVFFILGLIGGVVAVSMRTGASKPPVAQ
jgi:hypothetical protein